MRIRGQEAQITSEHPASSYGVPMLVIAGRAYENTEIKLNESQIKGATPREWLDLERAGYISPKRRAMTARIPEPIAAIAERIAAVRKRSINDILIEGIVQMCELSNQDSVSKGSARSDGL